LPAVVIAVRFSTPVVVLRVNEATLPAVKLLTNASAPLPGVGVAEELAPLPDAPIPSPGLPQEIV
jgi:hypothetical protein